MKDIKLRGVKIDHVTGINAARKLWNIYSAKDELWNIWRFKKVFIDVYKYPLMFVVARYKRSIAGVLPLWYEMNAKRYEYVSGWWSEKGEPFCKDIRIIRKMIDSLDSTVKLDAMTPETIKIFGDKAVRDYDHYGLDLTKVNNSWDGYLATLKAKKRQTIKWDIRQVEKRKFKIRYQKFSDLKYLFKLNIARMAVKSKMYDDEEKSVFETDRLQQEIFKQLWKKSGKEYRARIITTLIGKKVVSVDFNLIYQKKYYCLLGGQNVNSVTGIGAFANMLDINDAIKEGCNYVDFCMEDHHWKSKWFTGTPRYMAIYRKNKKNV